MSSGMIFLMLMVHDFNVVRLTGGFMLSFCWRTLHDCARSLARLSLELSLLSSLALTLRLRLGLGSTLSFFLVIILHGEVVLQARCGLALASGMPASWSFCLYLAASSCSSCS